MNFKHLLLGRSDNVKNVYIITLNRPPENRLDQATCQELIEAYRTVAGHRIDGEFRIMLTIAAGEADRSRR